MATPHHPTALSSGSGKALALLPGGGGQVQPIHVFQSSSQPSVTMVRVVTSVPPNGYSAVGGVEGNSDLRGTAVWGGGNLFLKCFFCVMQSFVMWYTGKCIRVFKAVVALFTSLTPPCFYRPVLGILGYSSVTPLLFSFTAQISNARYFL